MPKDTRPLPEAEKFEELWNRAIKKVPPGANHHYGFPCWDAVGAKWLAEEIWRLEREEKNP